MNKYIKNTIEQVSNSFPSLFSREDVIKLLIDLDAEMQTGPPAIIEKDVLIDTFKDVLADKEFGDIINTDDIELSLTYNNRIEIESVPIDEDELVNMVVNALEASWDALITISEE